MRTLRDRFGASRLVALPWLFVTVSLSAAGVQDAAARSDRIKIRMMPAPDQVIVMRQTQDITMNLDGAQGLPAGLPPSTVIIVKMTSSSTMNVGSADAEGRVQAQYKLDSFDNQSTLNGAPLPVGNIGREVIGQTTSVTFGDDDNVLDVQSDNPILKSILSAGFTGVPAVTLAIGESTTVHTQMAIPLPATTPLNAKLAITYTLQSVTTEPEGRVAHLDVSTTGGMEQTSSSPFAMTVTVSGGGTMDVSLEAGYVLHHAATTTFDVLMQPPTPANATEPPSPMKMHGTMKMTGEAHASR